MTNRTIHQISMIDAAHYEARSSWWICKVSWPWAQDLAARYIAWKVKRKYRRYAHSLLMLEQLPAMRREVGL